MSPNPQRYIKLSIFIFAILLSLSCSLFSGNPKPEPEPTLPVQIQSTPLPDSQGSISVDQVDIKYIYTSELITILYPLYGDILDDFFIITITNQNDKDVRVIIESEIVGYTSMAIDTVDVGTNESVEIRQNPLLIPEIIDTLNTQKPADAHLRVSLMEEGQKLLLLDQTHETLIYGRRDFPWSIEGFEPEEVYDLIAALVMPTDPAVEEMLRAAADYTDSGIITGGYSGVANDDDGKVWDRLEAIWQAQSEVYDITYIDTEVTFTPGFDQRIRLPVEVLEQRSGNCIELAILYASAAEAMRLESAIVLVPGHAFVAIRTDQQGATYYAIETTLVGRSTFSEAVDVGNEQFTYAMEHLDESGEGEWYGWVNIWSAREKGIHPLPWH